MFPGNGAKNLARPLCVCNLCASAASALVETSNIVDVKVWVIVPMGKTIQTSTKYATLNAYPANHQEFRFILY